MDRLELLTRRRSVVRYPDVIAVDRPLALWLLDEPAGHTAYTAPQINGGRFYASLNSGVLTGRSGPPRTRLAMETDGVDDYINLGSYPSYLGTTQPQSFELAVHCPSGLSSATSAMYAFGSANPNVFVIGLGAATGSLTNEVVSIGNGSGLRVGWSGFTLAAGWHLFCVTFGGASNTDWLCYIDGKDAVADLGGTLISAGGGCPGFSSQIFTLGRGLNTLYSNVRMAACAIYTHRLNRTQARAHADFLLSG